jgi:hypothetical protein
VDDAEFRRDLYQGTASYYDPFRGPCPRSLAELGRQLSTIEAMTASGRSSNS